MLVKKMDELVFYRKMDELVFYRGWKLWRCYPIMKPLAKEQVIDLIIVKEINCLNHDGWHELMALPTVR